MTKKTCLGPSITQEEQTWLRTHDDTLDDEGTLRSDLAMSINNEVEEAL